jgi:hypothetical protein
MDLQNWVDRHPIAFGVGLFGTLWLFVRFVISYASGWHSLHSSFPASDESLSNRSLTSGTFRYVVGYNNVLWVSSNRQGLHLAMLFLFRFGHPPVFIPWSEIEVRPERRFLGFRFRTLVLGRESRIPLMLKEKIVIKLLSNRDSL